MHTYIITNSENSGQPATRYITGFSGSDSTVIFASEKHLSDVNALQSMKWGKILVDGRYWEQAENEIQISQSEADPPLAENTSQWKIIKIHKDNTSKQAIAEILKQNSIFGSRT